LTMTGRCAHVEAGALAGDVERLLPAARALGLGPEAARDAALGWALTGGEDHGLLAAFPPGVALPAGFRRVGSVRPGPATVTVDGTEPAARGGWDHFGG
ncbi:thiamine-phosphate kinase, partial [Isoptericola sp. QY 916]|nr:thiamine-phosphate kinase [Isoptericola sp. QY 916]